MSRNIPFFRSIIFFIVFVVFIDSGQLFAYRSEGEAATGRQNTLKTSPVIYEPRIMRTFPHDPRAFTQGLVFDNGYLYEGTGLYGRSSLRKIVLETGDVVQKINLPKQFFGEGITIAQDKIVQLTWRSRIGFVYTRDHFELVSFFRFSTEGWGITYNGKQLIMSDGTEHLYFLDQKTYEISRKVRVHDDSGFVTKLNELEFIKGRIYANIWQSSRIAIIEPLTGQVKGWIELQELVQTAGGNDTTKTLNGIAYDEKSDRLFITGKLWPDIYEIRLSPSMD
jgi:glutamine cyclotransferase